MLATILAAAWLRHIAAPVPTDPAEAMRAINKIRVETENFDPSVRIEKMRAVAIKVNSERIPVARCLEWCLVFYEIQWLEKSVECGNRFLTIEHPGADQEQALETICFDYAFMHGTAGQFLKRHKELAVGMVQRHAPTSDRTHFVWSTASTFYRVIRDELGIDSARTMLREGERALPALRIVSKDDLPQYQKACLNLGLARSDLYDREGNMAQAIAAIEHVRSFADKDEVAGLNALINRLQLVGSVAPELRPTYEIGDFQSLKGKVVLLDFMAHWCRPCIAEFKLLGPLQQQLAPKGLELVGVTSLFGFYGQENAEKLNMPPATEIDRMKGFIKEHHLTWPTVFVDRDKMVKYGAAVLPTLVLIDKHGRIRGTWSGYIPSEMPKVRAEIERLLTEQ